MTAVTQIPCIFCRVLALEYIEVVEGFAINCKNCEAVGPVRKSKNEARQEYEKIARTSQPQDVGVSPELKEKIKEALWNALGEHEGQGERRYQYAKLYAEEQGDNLCVSFSVNFNELGDLAGNFLTELQHGKPELDRDELEEYREEYPEEEEETA